MKTFYSLILALLLVAGLSGTVSAITDPGTNYGPLDLTWATVEIYDRGDTEILAFTIEVTPHLPGAVVLECDVDDSTGTGGSLSIIGSPVSPCPCKVDPGFDIAVYIYTRRQGDASDSAFCAGCADGTGACERRRESGEWYAVASLAGQPERAIGVLRGMMDPIPFPPTAAHTKNTYWLPWSYIKAYVSESLSGNPQAFNWTKSEDPRNNKWQVSIFYDAAYSDGDDISSAGPVYDINDYAPDSGKSSTQIRYNVCQGNLNGPLDADIDGGDTSMFKTDFGRSIYNNPCPPYPGPITY